MSAKRVCVLCGAEYDADQKFCPKDGSPLRSAEVTDGFVGQIIADRYRVLSTIGEGGMGRVYLAEHVRMGRQCAVKVISPALASTDAAVARFNREAANASQINHPNVVQVYDFGEGPNHTLYLAMEYIDGETLSNIVRREGPLSVRRAAAITKQVAEALAAAHHRGIVHRDLKPDNILVTRHHDGTEWVKVVDFGIAKTVQGDAAEGRGGGQTVTTAGISIGTPEYMSPEQLAGERIDTRTDLYSLGLVFFHLLTADLPYPPGTSRENLIRRLTTSPRTLQDVQPNSNWPLNLQPVLNRALAADLDKRYPTATDFARDLAMLVAQSPEESDATVRLRSAGPVAAAATLTERPQPATTIIETSTPAVSPPVAVPPRARPQYWIGAAAVLVVVAVAGYALKQRPTTAAAKVDSVVRAPIELAVPETSLKAPVVAAQTAAVDSPVAMKPKPDTGALTPPKTTTTAPAVANRLAVLQRDVEKLVSLGRQHVIAGDVAKARNEFRRAAQEVTQAMMQLPNNPDAARLRDSTVRSLRGVVAQCQAAMQRGLLKVSEAGFRCPSLVPARFVGLGRGRG